MFHVVLDTNALQSNTLRFTEMMRLKVLIDSYILKLYIPDIVKREYLTQKIPNLTGKIKAKNISEVNKYIHYDSNDVKDSLNEANRLISETSKIIEKVVEDEFNDWVDDFAIEILPFNESKINEVLDGYFTGGTVFKSLKNRNDIPDAMIATTIKELQEKINDRVYVINNDKTFSNYLTEIGDFEVYDKISNLLENDKIKPVLIETEEKLEVFNHVNSIIRSEEFLTTYIKYLEDSDYYLYIQDGTEVIDSKILGNDIYNLWIELDSSVNRSTIKISDGLAISDDEVYFGISYNTDVTLSYVTNCIEYMEIEKSREVEYNKMNRSNGDVSLSEDRTINFNTSVILPIKDVCKDKISELFEFDDILISEQLEKIVILENKEQ